MIFDPDPIKQTQEASFSGKLKKVSHPPLVFNNVNVSQCKLHPSHLEEHNFKHSF